MPTSPFRFLFPFIRRQGLKFAFMLLASLVWAFNDVCLPWLLKQIIHTVELSQEAPASVFAAVSRPLGLLALLWFVMECAMRGRDLVELHTLPRFRAQIREVVFHYTQSQSHRYFSSQFAGNLAQKLNDLPIYCEHLVALVCLDFVTPTVGAAMVLAFMWRLAPVFAGVLMIWLSLHLGLTFLFFRLGKRRWEAHAEASTVLSGKVVDCFTNSLNVRLFARRRYEADYFSRFQQDEIQKAKKALWNNVVMRIGLGLSSSVLIFGMLGALLSGWQHGRTGAGDFTQVLMQSLWLLGWAWFVTFRLKDLAKAYGTVDNALILIRVPHEIRDARGAQPLRVRHGDIRFEQVAFAYHPRRPVFRNLSVSIPGGQKVGLVGFSGSGKSTFVHLLLRLYDPQAGSIQIDGQPISAVTQDSLHAQIGMIPQEPMLFHRSLKDNIRYGRLEASEAEIIDAAKKAHCHAFIEQLSEGYETLVGERGVKLSGGQRQRIAIARAILKGAPLLILDEATAALDSVTEKLIQASLRQLMQDRTTLVIAHRLSTLASMDWILVFHEGRIVEAGTQTELIAAGGHFAMLWTCQKDGFLPEDAALEEARMKQR